jgi:hypothetical protein
MKDSWQKFSSISTFLSSVVIAAIGIYFTNVYNERQSKREALLQEQHNKNLQMEILEKYIPHLTGEDEERKRAAIIMIKTLGNEELALALIEAYPTKGTKEAGDAIMVSSAAKIEDFGQRPITMTVREPTQKTKIKEGFAYLGDFSRKKDQWTTRYFEFPFNQNPDNLTGKTIKVRSETGALNVRDRILGKIIDVLGIGSEVKINTVREWGTTGYIWAHISYFPNVE